MEENEHGDDDLHRFRAEAADLLGVGDEPKTEDESTPADTEETLERL